jgi:multiple antibiotic resistance protein
VSDQTIHFIITLLQSTAALLIVLDPLGLLPIVVALTRQLSPAGRQSVVTQAVLTAFVLLMFFTLAGTGILSLFRVTINDLQIAGGILLLVIALSLVLSGRMSTESAPSSSASFVPLASPLLVGPGAITAAVVLVATNGILIASLRSLLPSSLPG